MCRSLLLVLVFLAIPPLARADAFDLYDNNLLAKVPNAEGVKLVKQLTPAMIIENSRVLPEGTAALVVVQTNDGRLGKLLVQAARKQLNDEAKTQVDILLIERFVTYRPGSDRTVHSTGQNVFLFDGFRFSMDLGQVVPEKLPADLRFVAGKDGVALEPVGKANLYLLTKPLPEATPKKTNKFVIGETFEIRYFNGKFKLYDDGRRSGTLQLKVDNEGEVTGSYFSDKDGAKYDVTGKVGAPKNSIVFTVKLPRTEQVFTGWLFTGTGMVLTGSSQMQGREAGFYATRMDEE